MIVAATLTIRGAEMADILYIQPHDRPWWYRREFLKWQKVGLMSRAMFEVLYQVPEKYSIDILDLNIAIKTGQSLSDAVFTKLKKIPRVVLISMPTFTHGVQIGEIVKAVRHQSNRLPIIIGGAAISLIHDAPLRWGFPVTGVYNGFGWELPQIIEACLSRTKLKIDGMYWDNMPNHGKVTRGEDKLLFAYFADDLYTSKGRLDFKAYLCSFQNAGIDPIALLEISRGCIHSCSFCAVNFSHFGYFFRLPEHAFSEAYYLAKHGIYDLRIIDPTFGIKWRKWRTLDLLKRFHQDYPWVKFKVSTRADMIEPEFIQAMSEAGISECDIGMETKEGKKLADVKKKIRPEMTCQAVEILSEHGIMTKLFHIAFPGKFSVDTIRFLADLSKRWLPFKVQSSFLRTLPDRNSPLDQIQDQTVFAPSRGDTLEQAMEIMLANVPFPSMSMVFDGREEARDALMLYLNEGGDLSNLFEVIRENGEDGGTSIVMTLGRKRFILPLCDRIPVEYILGEL